MITKEELNTRLFKMASIFFVSVLVSMCGFILIPELTIAEIDPNTLTLIKFMTITAFMVHITGMAAIGILLFSDTLERVMHCDECDGE